MDSKFSKKIPKKIKIIQSLRGLAALGVMFAHLWHSPTFIVINPLLNKLSKGGAYGVQIFFVISGFILPYSLFKHKFKLKNYFRFIMRRLVRLEPAYIVSIGLVLFFSNFFAPWLNVNFTSGHQNGNDLILHLLYLVPFYRDASWVQGVNWTLAIEFQYYLLIGFLIPFWFQKDKYGKIIRLISFIALLIASFYLRNKLMMPAWLTFFLAGNLACLFLLDFISKKVLYLALLGLSVATYFQFNSIYFSVITVATPLIILNFLTLKKAPFQFLGKISYSLYLTHGVVGVFLIKYSRKYLDYTSNFKQAIILFTICIVCIAVAAIFYYLFEKPFTKFSKRIKISN